MGEGRGCGGGKQRERRVGGDFSFYDYNFSKLFRNITR